MGERPSDTLTICDDARPVAPDGAVVFWNGYGEPGDHRFLLRYCDDHADRLRARYGAWIHDLGETVVAGKRVVEHLRLPNGLSIWWMTLLAEKSLWKSPAIKDVIRLFAVEDIVRERAPGLIRLVTANRALHESVSGLAARRGIRYEWRRVTGNPARRGDAQERFRALPHPVQALGSLARYVVSRWPLRRAKAVSWFAGESALCICSYFVNLVPELADAGTFRSRYWKELHALLESLGLNVNWLQLYVPHGEVPTPRVALSRVRAFNASPSVHEQHTFLDAYLTFGVVWNLVRNWGRLVAASLRLRDAERAFTPQGSHLSLWPLMRDGWFASLRGTVAIDNLLAVELFDAALRAAPRQPRGLYLSENQPWERALVHAWRANGHGELLAVPHSTRSFWDLRFFADERTLTDAGPLALPQPDLTAVNGAAALRVFRGENARDERFVPCEALRYTYLDATRRRPPHERAADGVIKVLVLGDYVRDCTTQMLRLLEAALPRLTARVTITIKPHPTYLVDGGDYPALQLHVVTQPLEGLLHEFDVAYSSNRTSAAVDAYLAGLPIVIVLDDVDLNFSPLRGHAGVRFVSTADELADALTTAVSNGSVPEDFFFLDAALPRWTRLLTAPGR